MSKKTGERLLKIADMKYEGNQSAMARDMEMTPQAANKYFRGEREPGIKILKRLVGIGINITWVVKGIGPMFLDRNPELTQLEAEGLEDISARIKWVRLSNNLIPEQISPLLHVSAETQTAIENGEREPWPEYIENLLAQFKDVREAWLKNNEEPKLHSQKASTPKEPEEEYQTETNYFKELDEMDLNQAEARLLGEVKKFSNFLETRPLNPQVKRLLLELLIESIDQELERRQRE